MTTEQAIAKLSDVIRRKHLALSTEQSYCAWLRRFCDCVKTLPVSSSSELKLEQFLTGLANTGISASTQNQALNAVLFFYPGPF